MAKKTKGQLIGEEINSYINSVVENFDIKENLSVVVENVNALLCKHRGLRKSDALQVTFLHLIKNCVPFKIWKYNNYKLNKILFDAKLKALTHDDSLATELFAFLKKRYYETYPDVKKFDDKLKNWIDICNLTRIPGVEKIACDLEKDLQSEIVIYAEFSPLLTELIRRLELEKNS